jgi:hypothetical protein
MSEDNDESVDLAPTKNSGTQFGWSVVIVGASIIIVILILIIALYYHVLGTGGGGQSLPGSGEF